MKATVLGLSIAAAAFAGSSLYFWQQLELERTRGAQLAETSRQLSARIAQLDQARQQFVHQRNTDGARVSGVFGSAPVPAAGRETSSETRPTRVDGGWAPPPPREMSASMDKMMRWQIRADHKRMYADIGSTLGLSKDKEGQLIDLLVEQQLAQFGSQAHSPWSSDPAEARRKLEEARRSNESAINDLLGPEKAQSLKEYQESLPARQEFELLVNQLAGNDVTLTPEQNRKLLAIYLEERRRVPMPAFESSLAKDPDAYHQAHTNWQDDYSGRVVAEARNILDATQLEAFNEVQEWQREMRSQFQAITFTSAPGAAVALPAGAVSVGVSGGAVVTAAPATDAGRPSKKGAQPSQP